MFGHSASTCVCVFTSFCHALHANDWWAIFVVVFSQVAFSSSLKYCTCLCSLQLELLWFRLAWFPSLGASCKLLYLWFIISFFHPFFELVHYIPVYFPFCVIFTFYIVIWFNSTFLLCVFQESFPPTLCLVFSYCFQQIAPSFFQSVFPLWFCSPADIVELFRCRAVRLSVRLPVHPSTFFPIA